MSNLRQLAKTLDLSITTVSRALNGYSDVSEKTRQRVEDAARKAGYRPNAAARRLRCKRTELVVVPLPSVPGQIGAPHFMSILSECAGQLAMHGMDMVVAPVSSPQYELQLCQRLIAGKRVDAMVLVRTQRQDKRVELLQAQGIPFVTHGRTESSLPHPFLDGDGRAGFYDAVKLLIKDGHTRIGLLGGPQVYTFSFLRYQGWLAALEEHGLETHWVAENMLSEQGGYEATHLLMSQVPAPTALLCTTDEMALGALHALREIKGGHLVSVIGHDDLPISAFSSPRLSTMRMGGDKLGQRLAFLLLRAIAGEPVHTLQEVYPVDFIARDSHRRLF